MQLSKPVLKSSMTSVLVVSIQICLLSPRSIGWACLDAYPSTQKTVQGGPLDAVNIVAEVTQHLRFPRRWLLELNEMPFASTGHRFGKTVGQNLALIGQLKRFRPLERQS